MKVFRILLFLMMMFGLYYLEASRMFVADTSVQSSILYPLCILASAVLALVVLRKHSLNNQCLLPFLIIFTYSVAVLHSLEAPFPAKSCYITLLLPAICFYFPLRLIENGFNKNFFIYGSIVVYVLLTFFYYYNYQNNAWIEIQNQNNAAYTLLFFTPLLLCCNNRYVRYIILALTGVALLFSLKRSGIVAYMLALASFLFIDIFVNKSSKNRLMLLIIVVLGLYGLYNVSQFFLGARSELLINRFTLLEEGDSERTQIYNTTIQMIAKNDLVDYVTGHGYGGVAKDSPLKCSAHNDYLEFMYDYGIIGLTLLLLFVIHFIKYVISLIRRKSSYAAPAMFALVIILVNSCFSHVFYYEWYLLLITLFIGYIRWAANVEDCLSVK